MRFEKFHAGDSVAPEEVRVPSFKEQDAILYDVDRTYENKDSVESHDDMSLEALAEEVSSLPEFDEYEKLPINYETLDSILVEFDEKIARIGDSTGVERLRRTLSKLIDDVKYSTRAYYETVAQFTHFVNGSARDKLEPADYREERERRDRRRRLAHNSLIDNLRILSRFCAQKVPEHFDGEISISKKKYFSSEKLADRAYITHWAYAVELGHRTHELAELIHEVMEKRKGASAA